MERSLLPKQAGLGCFQASKMQQICGHSVQPFRKHSTSRITRKVHRRAANSDEEFESNLKRIREASGKTPYGESRKPKGKEGSGGAAQPKQYDFSGETVYFQGPPHRGDLAVNVALGTTLLWLPLTFAAVGRAAFVSYRFTDKRLSVITKAPWKSEQLDAAYQEVKDVVVVGRGVGIWGDMVVTLNNNDKIELRSLPQFQELRKYILERRDALVDPAVGGSSGGKRPQTSQKGFSS